MSSAIFFFFFFATPLPTLSKDYEVCKSVLRIFFSARDQNGQDCPLK